MERLLTKKDLELQLEGKRSDIDARIDALKSEIEGAGNDAKKVLVEQPMKVLTGVLIAGAVVGLLVLGSKKRKHKKHLRRSHRALIDRYTEALAADVRRRIKRGEEEGKALRAAFRDRMPLVVVQDEEPEVKGMAREAMDLALKTALGFAIKTLVDRLSTEFDVEGQVDRLVSGLMGSAAGGGSVPQAPAPDEQVG